MRHLPAGLNCVLHAPRFLGVLLPLVSGVSTLSGQVVSTPTPCATFPSGLVPFVSIDYVSDVASDGSRLVVGTLGGSAPLELLNRIPMPSGTNQFYCDAVELAPGLFAMAFVPNALERSGNYSAYSSILLDPLNCQNT